MTPLDPQKPIEVLAVDDSAVVRQVLTQILSNAPGIAIRTAADAHIAQEKMNRLMPDVMILDLELPRMHGLDFLAQLMSTRPMPVIICSNAVGSASDKAVRALELGAVDIIAKPQMAAGEFLERSVERIVEAVRGAASASFPSRAARKPPARSPSRPVAKGVSGEVQTENRIIAIGASTGGTEAVRFILEALPADSPAILVVQHMPEHFTLAYARRLATSCRMEVKEAEDGDILRPGLALIAQGNRHLEVTGLGVQKRVHLGDGAQVNYHRPSVDVLFQSVASKAGPLAMGILLTGMGQDGAKGLLEMRRRGCYTAAQDEGSSIVYGMPKKAVEMGAAAAVSSLENMPALIQGWLSGNP